MSTMRIPTKPFVTLSSTLPQSLQALRPLRTSLRTRKIALADEAAIARRARSSQRFFNNAGKTAFASTAATATAGIPIRAVADTGVNVGSYKPANYWEAISLANSPVLSSLAIIFTVVFFSLSSLKSEVTSNISAVKTELKADIAVINSKIDSMNSKIDLLTSTIAARLDNQDVKLELQDKTIDLFGKAK